MMIEKIRPTQVIETETYDKHENHKDVNGKANAGLTLGIIGTAGAALALFGQHCKNNHSYNNVNSPSPFQVWNKECEDRIALTNTIWGLQVGSMARDAAHREVDVNEKFRLYKSTDDDIKALNERINNELFSLYRYTRDKDDETRKEISDLRTQVAINTAIRPYQDKLIQCEIDKAYASSVNYTNRKTCNVIYGQVILPEKPLICGYGSYSACTKPEEEK